MALTIGVDVGGTKVAAGVVDDGGRVLARARRDTPSHDPDAVEDLIAELVRELSDTYDIEAVGIGAAGFVDAERATVLFAPNLAWRREPLRDDVQKRIGLPVVVENDANAAAWGEARFGAGRGVSTLVVITVGTGIGGGLIVDGSLYRGRYGMAAEFGHMRVVPGGLRCGCGNKGCWEQYASGNALVREARDLALVGSPLAVRMLELAGGDAAQITGPLVTQAAMEGDPVAVELFEEVGGWLGAGLANLAAVFDPEVFVVGGGVSEAGDLLLAPARAAYHLRLTGRGHRPEAEIRPAALGNDAGLIGAADLARHRRD